MYLRKWYPLHNMHFMQKDIYWRNREETRRQFLRTTTRRRKKGQGRIQTLIILDNTWRSVAFSYTRVTLKAVKI